MSPVFFTLISVLVVSLLSLVGIIFLILSEKLLSKALPFLVAFASGALLGGAFLHLLEESKDFPNVWLWTFVGIVVFFCMEKFLRWRHCHRSKCAIHAFAYLNLWGDGIHNAIDGAIIAVSFLTDFSLGVAVTIAIMAHELPQEIGDFGILVYAGLSKRKALFYNLLSALAAFIGVILVFFLSAKEEQIRFLLPVAAGGFIYIACVDLIPELHITLDLKNSTLQLIAILLGIGIMWILR